jgi:type VI secretion system protein
MREDRLLERIRTWEKEPAKRGSEDPGKIVDSVVRHLQRILNTRQGNVPIAEDYGIPDLLDFLQTYPESVREIERALKLAIQKYEPRLQAVKVRLVPQEEDILSLRFQIVAKLSTETRRQVLFETLIDADGKIDVQS